MVSGASWALEPVGARAAAKSNIVLKVVFISVCKVKKKTHTLKYNVVCADGGNHFPVHLCEHFCGELRYVNESSC